MCIPKYLFSGQYNKLWIDIMVESKFAGNPNFFLKSAKELTSHTGEHQIWNSVC